MAKGVQLVRSRDDAVKAAASLLGKTLVTYQTGAEGQAISKVLITVGHDIAPVSSTSGWRSIAACSARC